MSNETGILSVSLRKCDEWVQIELPNNQLIKMLVKDHPSKNRRQCNVVISCPKELKIKRVKNDSVGNHG